MAKKIRNLSNLERAKIIQIILLKCINGKPVRGTMLELAQQYGVTRKAITNLWKEAKQQRDAWELINVNSKLKGREGTNKVTFDAARFKSIHYKLRTTQKRVAAAMVVSQSTVSRWVKSKVIRSHTNALKPSLTDKNKLARLIFCLSKLYYDEMLSKIMFKDQGNLIHIDEKWFYITKDGQRYYLSQTEPDQEEEPFISVQSKSYIGKIMFMCAVARPKFSNNNECVFNGNIGIWPFVSLEPAQRNSKNRVAGTLETKPIESITKPVIKNMMLGVVLPEIKRKWPANASKNIFIQQDNARSHISNNDPDFREAASSDGWNIQLVQQPPNSPDLNVLDLGFFRAIQSLQTLTNSYKLNELVVAVKTVFDNLEVIKLNYVFITMQGCNAENITELVDAVMSDSPYLIE
ncbi:uncharacterized protein LOC141632478 [Silene latifolia]|uniref:uncharacterized protein LOC141632478 n=1 Tax=Silene latifolia TaxID=37657 RepID=UPI003D775FF5